MSILRSTLLSAAALVLLAGCGEAGGADDPAGSDAGLADLKGRSFQSVSLVDGADKPLQPGTRVTVSFSEDGVSGSAGCNSIGSTATVADGRLVVRGAVGGTEAGCGKRQYHDEWISDLLTSRPRLELDGDRLTLTSGGTVVELVDSDSAEPDRPLAGPLGAEPGCNRMTGWYEVDGDRMTLERMATTEMFCSDAAIQIESTVLELLSGLVTWSIEGSQLRLAKGDQTLVYRAG
jgi:heat shock protein HslJ